MAIPFFKEIKIGSYLVKQKLMGRKRYPLVLMLEPLFRCNLACVGCGKIDYPDAILNRRMSAQECWDAAEECGAPPGARVRRARPRDAARVRRIQPGEEVQERRLARARLAADAHALAGRDVQVDAPQHLEADVATRVALAQRAGAKDGLTHCAGPPPA